MATEAAVDWATKDEKRANRGSMKQVKSRLVQVGFLAIEGGATLVYSIGCIHLARQAWGAFGLAFR